MATRLKTYALQEKSSIFQEILFQNGPKFVTVTAVSLYYVFQCAGIPKNSIRVQSNVSKSGINKNFLYTL